MTLTGTLTNMGSKETSMTLDKISNLNDLRDLSLDIPRAYRHKVVQPLYFKALKRAIGWVGLPEGVTFEQMQRGYRYLVFKSEKNFSVALELAVQRRLASYLSGDLALTHPHGVNARQKSIISKHTKIRSPKNVITYLTARYNLNQTPKGFEVFRLTGMLRDLRLIEDQAESLKRQKGVKDLRELKRDRDYMKHKSFVLNKLHLARQRYRENTIQDILEGLKVGYSPLGNPLTEKILKDDLSSLFELGYLSVDMKKVVKELSSFAHVAVGEPKLVNGYQVYAFKNSDLWDLQDGILSGLGLEITKLK
jgi:hypothetical protein